MAQFTKYTGNLQGANGSLITALDAALVTGQGWTKAYSAANKAAYRAPSGNQLYFRVQDDGPGLGGAKEARLTGYETMSDVDTGTNPFPTAAQGVGGVAMVVIRKSADAGTNRPYKIWADARSCMGFVFTGDNAAVQMAFMFGEVYSALVGDAWNSMVIGRQTENSSTITNDRLDLFSAFNASITAHFIARSYTGLPIANGSLAVGKHGDVAKGSASVLIGTTTYPNPVDGGLYLSPVWIHEVSSIVRGRMRGLWQPLHAIASFTDGDTFSGTGDLSGKTFEVVKQGGNGGVYMIETSNTLETN